MLKPVVLTSLLALAFASGAVANAATVPCEDMLKQLRDAETSAKLSEADKAKVADLEGKGVARCNADDDKRADKFFGDALAIVTQK